MSTYGVQQVGAGANDDTICQVDRTYQASRASLRPTDWATREWTGGHYAAGGMTGLMAAAIASQAQVFQVRWADPSKLFVLKKLVVQFSTATGFAATTVGAPVELIVGHGSTASGSGGATIAPNSASNKMRTGMSSSAFVSSGEIRISTTAALTAATGQTLEASSIAACMGADNRTLVSTPPFPLWNQEAAGDHPLILATGDTFAIRTVSPAATGTWYMSVAMSWFEGNTY